MLTRLQIPKSAPVVQVALGEHHGLALTAYGTALVWGMEQSPPLGFGTNEFGQSPGGGYLPAQATFNQPTPRALDVQGKVVFIAAGGYHSALITEDGRLWTWGQNARKQLGQDTKAPDIHQPRLVDALAGHKMVSACLGGFHSAAIDSAGTVFTWGDNKRGQCGQGELDVVDIPTALSFPNGQSCTGASCGGFFSFFRVKLDTSDSAVYFACGWGKEGCLGFGQVCKRMLRPQRLPHLKEGRRWAYIEA